METKQHSMTLSQLLLTAFVVSLLIAVGSAIGEVTAQWLFTREHAMKVVAGIRVAVENLPIIRLCGALGGVAVSTVGVWIGRMELMHAGMLLALVSVAAMFIR